MSLISSSYTSGKWLHPTIKPKVIIDGTDFMTPKAQDTIDAINLRTTYSSGYTMPDHYLQPMTMEQINRRAFLTGLREWMMIQPGNRTPAKFVTAQILGILEFYNLVFVNKLGIDWNFLQSAYKGASEDISVIESAEAGRGSFKEQLRKAATVGISMVAGLLKGGPIGFFVGAASATMKIVNDERQKFQERAMKLLNPGMQNVVAAEQAKAEIEEQESTAKLYYAAGGIALLIGVAVFVYRYNN